MMGIIGGITSLVGLGFSKEPISAPTSTVSKTKDVMCSNLFEKMHKSSEEQPVLFEYKSQKYCSWKKNREDGWHLYIQNEKDFDESSRENRLDLFPNEKGDLTIDKALFSEAELEKQNLVRSLAEALQLSSFPKAVPSFTISSSSLKPIKDSTIQSDEVTWTGLFSKMIKSSEEEPVLFEYKGQNYVGWKKNREDGWHLYIQNEKDFNESTRENRLDLFPNEKGDLTIDKALFSVAELEKQNLVNSLNQSLTKQTPSPKTIPVKKNPDLQVVFPELLSKVKIASKELGGTTGAKLVESTDGMTKWVKKTSLVGKEGHLIAEYYANKVYKQMGTLVPDVTLYHTVSGQALLAHEKLPSTVTMLASFQHGVSLNEYLAKSSEDQSKSVKKEIQKDFVLDCLLGNYDVIGWSRDNILVTPQGHPYRIDNGSAFEYRAQGSYKTDTYTKPGDKVWGPVVHELTDLRKKSSTTPEEMLNACMIFEDISNEEIIRQIDAITAKKEALIAILPDRYKDIMRKRVENLIQQKKTL